MTALAALSISMTSFAMTTEEFDKNTQLGLKLYNSGLYSQAKDELQKFCDKNWDTLNKGQQEYIQGYLNDAKQKSKQASKPKKKEIVGEVFVPLTTEEFDAGMSKGIDYFNRGLYYEAKDEFQWLYNGKWNNMNEGQRQYLSDYLSGTRAKIAEMNSKSNNTANTSSKKSTSSISTKDFDTGMAKGIKYFQQGNYYNAMLAFQDFCDKNWGKMNEGQQKYALDYLGSAKAKINWNDVLTKAKQVVKAADKAVKQVKDARKRLEEDRYALQHGSLINTGYWDTGLLN